MANLEFSKANRTKVIKSFPTKEMGKEGDIVISHIASKGYFLCTKVGNTWYAANKLNELKRLRTPSLQDLKVDSLQVNNLRIPKKPVNGEISLSKGDLTLDVEKDITLDSGGDITLDAGGTDIHFAAAGTSYLSWSAGGTLTMKAIIDTEDSLSFIVSNNGISQINTIDSSASNLAHLTLRPMGDLKITPSTGIMYLYDDDNAADYAKFTVGANGDLTLETVDANASAANLTLDVDGDIELNADGGDITFKDDSADLATINGSGLKIDNVTEVGSDTDKFLMSDSGVVKYVTGANLLSYIGGGTSSVGALNDLSDVAYSSGDLTISSLDTIVAGADLTLDVAGDIELNADGGDITFKDDGVTLGWFQKNASTSTFFTVNSLIGTANYFRINTAANGATKLTTVDSDGSAGHLTLGPNGSLVFNPSDGKYIAQKDGTEFSAADSAYAGMILGYTRIQDNSTSPGTDYITIDSSSMAVLQTIAGTNLSINFKVPPSGNVEIDCKFFVQATSDGAKFSLSTGTSYAELDETHTYDADYTFFVDETDHYVVNVVFAVTGLTPGTDTTYYLAGLASGASTFIRHGRFRTTGLHCPPIILKATALPATITTGE